MTRFQNRKYLYYVIIASDRRDRSNLYLFAGNRLVTSFLAMTHDPKRAD
jgi:hypothetical protein